MSEFNLIWRRYNLKSNPYFVTPLSIDDQEISVSSFIGRNKEKEQLKKIIGMGGDVRYLITGEPGVGKTSLLNYIRAEASKQQFFTPINEIEINKPLSSNEFIVLTLSALYSEIQRQRIILREDLMHKLGALYELTQYGELSHDISKLTQLNTHKLIALFKEVIGNLVRPRFNGIIIHYDNIDNIDNLNALLVMFGEIRDFLLSHKSIIFFFVGDKVVADILNEKPRIGQIFISPPLEVPTLSLSDTKKILEERIHRLKFESAIPISPHTEESLTLLFNLFEGNLREILNSLTNCVLALPSSNTPIKITPEVMIELLRKKVKEIYLDKLSPVEKQVLLKILEKEEITPSELSKATGKSFQNISSKYIPKLLEVGAIKFRTKEGRKKVYTISPPLKWWNLTIEKKDEKGLEQKKQKTIKELDRTLIEFM